MQHILPQIYMDAVYGWDYADTFTDDKNTFHTFLCFFSNLVALSQIIYFCFIFTANIINEKGTLLCVAWLVKKIKENV